MGFFKMMKINARRALSGFWGRAILAMLIMALPTILINVLENGMRQVVGVPAFVDYAMTPGNALDDMANVAAASIVISLLVYALLFLIVTPLSQGVLAWYYRRTGGADDSLTTLFSYFEQAGTYFRSIGLHFMIGLKMFFWALLLYSPLFAMAAMFIISGGDQPRAVILFAFLLSVVWLLIATVLLTIVGLRYFLAPYLLAAYPGRRIRALIRDGVRKVNGHKGRLFLFSLSFIGWYLPLAAVLGLIIFLPFASNVFMTLQILGIMILLLVLQLGLMLFVGPYTRAAFAMYARYLIERSEHDDMDSGADNRTREYKPEIDHYLESQRTRELSGGAGDGPNPHDPPV